MNKSKLAKSSIIVAIITILSKLTGLLRDTMVAYCFGTTYKTDCYVMALTIPNVIFGIIGVAIITAFIPMLIDTNKESGRIEMYKFANSVMNLLMLISIVLLFICFLITPNLVTLFAPDYSGRSRSLTILLTKISVFNLLFLSLNSSYTAILQSLDEFTAPALVGIAMNIPIIIYIWLGNTNNIFGLMVVTLIGNGLQIVVQIPWLIKHKYKYSFRINFKDKRLKKLVLFIAPVIIGTGVNQIDSIVQNVIASGLPDGMVSALDFSNKLFGMLYFTIAGTVVTIIFPQLSKDGALEDLTTFKEHLKVSLNNINLILVPATFALIVLRIPIITILFKRGKFNQASVNLTSEVLVFLLLGIVFWAVRDVFNRAFYALQDNKIPTRNGIFAVLTDIVLSIFLAKIMGVSGLTLATSLSTMLSCILLAKDLRTKIGPLNGMKMLSSFLKIFFASLVMGIVIYFINSSLEVYMIGLKKQIITMIICGIAGMIVYLLMLWLLRVNEFITILSSLKERRERRLSI